MSGFERYGAGGYYEADIEDSCATAKVGSYKPNAWGLYDLHGNVYEWCLDWLGDYGTEAVLDPVGLILSSGRHVIRGGSWYNQKVRNCRSAMRHADYSSSYESTRGFRIVCLP